MGVALFGRIQTSFVEKSRGGVGEDGVRWEPLRRETAAARRSTPAQDRRRRQLWAGHRARLMARFGMSTAEAGALAAKLARGVPAAAGAGDVCLDTGAYFRSLTPGVEDRPSGAVGQVFETPPGAVVVGSNLPYAGAQHARRPLWPRDGGLPAAWWDAIALAARRGVARQLRAAVTRGV